uniref:Secreted phosphoprotein 24 n=1 Tax=Leptobrachium leishanense TaxID=445787 RepID=A0A8C5PZ28_9ANUR
SETKSMRRIQLGVLVLHLLACSGFPTYDYNEDIIRTALNASLARLNNESRGKHLYRITRSNVLRVSVSDSLGQMQTESYADITLEFNVRETTCNKNSARDPTTCNFKIGHSVVSSHYENRKAFHQKNIFCSVNNLSTIKPSSG